MCLSSLSLSNVFDLALRYVLLFVLYGVWTVCLAIGSMLIIPGLIMLILAVLLLDPVRSLERGGSPLRTEHIGLAAGTILPMAVLWFLASQVIGFVQLWALSQSQLVMFASETGVELVWLSVLMMYCLSCRARG